MPLQPCGGHDMNTPEGMFAYGFCQTGVSAAVSKVTALFACHAWLPSVLLSTDLSLVKDGFHMLDA